MSELAALRVSRTLLLPDDVARLNELGAAPVFSVFQHVAGSPRGLTEHEAAERLQRFGANEPAGNRDAVLRVRVVAAVRSPFVALLAGLGVVFVLAADLRGSVMVAVMVVLAVALRIWQQTRTVRAAAALRKLVTSTVTVRRRADASQDPQEREIPPEDLVPGDIVMLCPGDIVAADLRIVSSADLVVDQAVLSGESLPVFKASTALPKSPGLARDPLVDTPTLCFCGTAVVGGTATGVVIATGESTYSGSLARGAAGLRPESSFDRGVRTVGWTLIRFMFVMAPIVFAVNGFVSGNWAQAAMFAVAVAVGLTPEMLPVIVTTNLARGATRLAGERVVVSRLNAIQDLGAMDVLCVDKTGTLTEDRIVYAHGIDVAGRTDDGVTELAYLTVHFQDAPHDRIDDAIIELLAEQDMPIVADAAFDKIDEIGFDHTRRRTTVVLTRQRGEHMLICKGDPDHVIALCNRATLCGEDVALRDDIRAEADDLVLAHRKQGMRVLAVAMKTVPAQLERYTEAHERDLVLAGFVGFVDPIRKSAAGAVDELAHHGVAVKILTGDSRIVARQVAASVKVDSEVIVVGSDIDRYTDRKLRATAEHANVFAELAPGHKARIVAALRRSGHTVGFLGDGVNDVAALRVADAGIAADTASDVAKQAADLMLLEKDLAVVARGVVEGRRTLANTMKYVKITASSNFGNVLSVVAASVLLPFLPILPIQLMVQNLLYDTAQLSLPWDRVDDDYLGAPRRWESRGLVRFMLIFGTLSSTFDLATFAALWWVFGGNDSPALFQTGWFVEGLLTQLLVVLVLRTRTLPWHGQRAARVVVLAAAVAAAIGLLLPVSPVAAALMMNPPPLAYSVWLLAVTVAYALSAQLVKRLYVRRHRTWL